METPKEYHYTYYSYEEWGRGYFGSRTCKCLPEDDIKYFGSFSDKNFKPTQKIILKSDYTTREEAYDDEIILQRFYKVAENSHFANRSYQTSTKFYCPEDIRRSAGSKGGSISGKISGLKTYELGVGIHGLTPEQRTENSKKGAKRAKELNVGIFGITPEERSKNSKKAGSIGGRKNVELGTGLFSMAEEEKQKARSEGGKKGGKKGGNRTKELGVGFFAMSEEEKYQARSKGAKTGIGGKKAKELEVGIFSLSKEQRSENAKKINSQRWMCTETGFISTPGSLTKYQRNRNIDTSQRVRVS
jgi:hypothetical protein